MKNVKSKTPKDKSVRTLRRVRVWAYENPLLCVLAGIGIYIIVCIIAFSVMLSSLFAMLRCINK